MKKWSVILILMMINQNLRKLHLRAHNLLVRTYDVSQVLVLVDNPREKGTRGNRMFGGVIGYQSCQPTSPFKFRIRLSLSIYHGKHSDLIMEKDKTRLRKEHWKSRDSCLPCKTRRTRCDERKPIW
jgi:hypothetical protein